MSGPYLHGHHASVLRSHSWRTVENSCPHLLPFLNKPSLKILDVGCGRFEVGDIFEWNKLEGVEEQGFDVVHAHQVLQHLQDPLGAMKEMKRLAKTGGILAIRDCNYGAMDWYPDHPMLHKWKKLYIKVALGLKAHPNIGKQLHAIAMEAGFPRSDIEASVAAWTFSTPEEREFWCGLWADRTVQSDYKKRALDSGHATEQDLEEISAAFREMEKKEDGWLVVINGQIICHVR